MERSSAGPNPIVAILKPHHTVPKQSFKEWVAKSGRVVRSLWRRPANPRSIGQAIHSHVTILIPAIRQDAASAQKKIASLTPYIVSPVRTHWKSAMILFLISLVCLEGVLHASALLNWSMLQLRRKSSVQTNRTVLFIGDSYTAGKFTSYSVKPFSDALDVLLQKRHAGWKTVNFSAPHLTSSDALHALPILLKKERPAVVYIMVGINDFLDSRPEPVLEQAMNEDQRPTRIFRTSMLMDSWKNYGFLTGLFDVIALPPVYVSTENLILSSKTQVLSEGEFAKLLKIADATGDSPQDESQTNAGLPINLIQVDSDLVRQTLPGWFQLKQGSFDLAELEFRKAIQVNRDDALAHAGLVETYYSLGVHSKARKEIAWLQTAYETRPDPVNAAALAYALPFESSADDISRITTNILKRYPRNPFFWMTLGRCGFLSGRQSFAVQAVDRALQLVPAGMSLLKASFLRSRAEMISQQDPATALVSLMEAYLLDGDEYLYIDSIRNAGRSYLGTDLDKCLAKLSCSQDKKDRITAVTNEALDESLVRMLAQLESNLSRMSELCHYFKVDPVFLSYPVPQPHVGHISRKVARRTGGTWLNLEAYFEVLLKNDSKEQLMRRDRFTAVAYQKIADWIAQDLANRSR